MIEMRLHGRGGQGTVMATEMIASSLLKEGQDVACFPFFGSERRGAPVQAYLRYGNERIRVRNKIYNPSIIMMFDSMLAKDSTYYKGLKSDGIVVVNSDIETMSSVVPPECQKILICNANKIALEVMNRSITNTTMIGCFARATGAIRMESVKETLSEYFSGKLLELNSICAERGFEESELYVRQDDGNFARA